jgi:uncharacterized protein with FMN-binding domain
MVSKNDTGSPGKIVLAAASTAVAVGLLFGYSTSTGGHVGPATIIVASGPAGSTGSSGTTSPSTTTAPTTPTATAPSTTTPATAAPSPATPTTTTYDGSVAQTRWGPVQVQITVTDGKVTAATALQVPDGNRRDQEINSYAVPILNQETVQAGSAQIDTVSGATVTSLGYLESLQAALDAAHLS